ncbi:MAG: hypothetical protein ACLPSL_08790 [Smithella sp.]
MKIDIPAIGETIGCGDIEICMVSGLLSQLFPSRYFSTIMIL